MTISDKTVDDKPAIVVDNTLLERLFGNLYQNRIIYHERITVLAEVERFKLRENEFDLWFRPVRLLITLDHPEVAEMYERWVQRATCQIGVNFGIPDMPYYYHSTGRLSMPYGPGTIWPNYELVRQVSMLSDDNLERNVRRLLSQN